MEKRTFYYAVVNDNGEQVLNALQLKGGTLSEELAKVTPRNGEIYFIDEVGDIDAYDNADSFQRCVLDKFLGSSGVEYVCLSDSEVRDIWRKIYIIADGKEETGKRIIAELEKRGGSNVGNLNCTAYHTAYFIEGNGGKITACDLTKMLDEWGFIRYELPTLTEPAPAPDIAQAQHQKVYIVQDGSLNGADIIEELERRGGVNKDDLDGEIEKQEEPALYYIDDNGRIDTTWSHNLDALLQQGYTRVYLRNAYDSADERFVMKSVDVHAATYDDVNKELGIALNAPQGWEFVNGDGGQITDICVKLRRKRWMPVAFYYYVEMESNGRFGVKYELWLPASIDKTNYDTGNCFATKEQAQRLADALNATFETTIEKIHKEQ